jgi:hypothetical protein
MKKRDLQTLYFSNQKAWANNKLKTPILDSTKMKSSSWTVALFNTDHLPTVDTAKIEMKTQPTLGSSPNQNLSDPIDSLLTKNKNSVP